MELYRFLQQQGFGGRKACRELVDYGLVELDGVPASDWRMAVEPAAIRTLCVDGEPWPVLALPCYLMLHKPAGYETSHQPQHHLSVYRLLPWQFANLGISAVGRLDVDTTGLLLFSTDGQFVHSLSSPRKVIPKCYQVTTRHAVTPQLLQQLRDGVLLHDESAPLAATQVEQLDAHRFNMSITQGKYHQVKRMVAAAGNRVEQLHRIAMGELALGNLAEGQWRLLDAAELALLGYPAPGRHRPVAG